MSWGACWHCCWLAGLILLCRATHAAAAAELSTQCSKPTIIAVGDGLTEGAFARRNDGWGLQLQERYVRKVRLMTRRCGGAPDLQ